MIFAVALGGGIGAGARYLIDKALPHPWGTVTVNLVGSFLLGLLAALFVREGALAGSATWFAMLGAGFCGGLTTFSTASINALQVSDEQGQGRSAAFVFGMLAGAVALAALGMLIGSRLLPGPGTSH